MGRYLGPEEEVDLPLGHGLGWVAAVGLQPLAELPALLVGAVPGVGSRRWGRGGGE